MSPRTAEPRAHADESDGPDEAASSEASIEDLAARGDVDGLLALARALRRGAGGAPPDLARCLEAFRAAAELGSAEAEHAAALFYLAGSVVPRDEREAAARLRRAADAGYTPAKVYLANLYELGIHYKADAAKADVWYRSAARSGGVTAEPGAPEHARAMADLGCVRHCLALIAAPETSDEDRAHFTRKAKAYGYREPRSTGATPAPASCPEPAGLEAAEEAAVSTRGRARAEDERRPAESAATAPAKAPPRAARSTAWGAGLTAFLYAAIFMAAALAGGFAALHGARALVADGQPVPVVGERLDLILPAAVVAVGVLPALLVYRIGASLRAIGVGALAAGAGAILWDVPATSLLETRPLEAVAFGAAGFLGALLVLGVLGGAKGGDAKSARI